MKFLSILALASAVSTTFASYLGPVARASLGEQCGGVSYLLVSHKSLPLTPSVP